MSGNSLAGARTSPSDPGNPDGRQYRSTTTAKVTVQGGTVVKSVSPASATVGQTVTYTVRETLPPNVTFYATSLVDTLPSGIQVNSVQLSTVTCTNPDGTACTPAAATPLTASGTTIGWLLGDAAPSAVTRTITLTYTARVADVPAAKAGAKLVNSARLAWNNTSRPPPTSAGAPFDQKSAPGAATATTCATGSPIRD